MKRRKSQQLFQDALARIPGGVNSPVRAFKAVGGDPVFLRSAKGSKVVDVDGNSYVDYVGSWGPMILGHAPPRVIASIAKTAKSGTSFGAPCEYEVRLAEEVVKAVPSIQKVRFVSSGTEAVMGAIRAARGFTGRKKIIKFDGCYHGHADYLLVKAGSGAQTLGQPDSAGVPQEFTAETLVARFNDDTSVEAAFKAYPSEIAAVIVEPVVGNMGVILPRDGFLQKLRKICDRNETVLIFDEVMTGFRLAYGGAQEVYGVKADLTTLGKILGGGMPVGAYGGRSEIMDMVAPVGPVYQAGTLSGNPVAMAAGLETLKILKATKPYRKLEKTTSALCDGLRDAAKAAGVPVLVALAGSMFTVFFTEGEMKCAEDARRADKDRFGVFFRAMLESGIYLAPSQFEACFVSTAHTAADFQKTLKAARKAFES